MDEKNLTKTFDVEFVCLNQLLSPRPRPANLSFDLLKRNTIVWGAGKHSVAGRSHCKINQIDFHKNPQVFIISKPDFGINKNNITKSILLQDCEYKECPKKNDY